MAFGPYLKDAGFSHAQPLLPTSISTSSGDDAHPFLHWKGTGLISLLVFTPESALLLWGLCEVRCGSEPCFPVGFPHFHAKKRQQMWWSNNSVCRKCCIPEFLVLFCFRSWPYSWWLPLCSCHSKLKLWDPVTNWCFVIACGLWNSTS